MQKEFTEISDKTKILSSRACLNPENSFLMSNDIESHLSKYEGIVCEDKNKEGNIRNSERRPEDNNQISSLNSSFTPLNKLGIKKQTFLLPNS